MRQYTHSRHFQPTAEQDSAVRYLDRLRNALTHYSDTTESVLVAELPSLVVDCLSVVRWLYSESNNISFYDQSDEARIEKAMSAIAQECHRQTAWWDARAQANPGTSPARR
jgi:hypothetical protein